jgi:hypothetical protein
MVFAAEPYATSRTSSDCDFTSAGWREAVERIAAGYDATAQKHDRIAAAMDRAGRFDLAELHEREAERVRKRAADERDRAASIG